ncbi:MAG: 5'-methylthioadenosine/adenosylhomocysteine nucleosidase [Clostridia bacterium]|nr:5'-methylthioadenosine/adenosylhomocysteine nucleosidase [Clostridia bacterium]
MIGIIGAMSVETEALCAALCDPKSRTVSGITYTSGTLEGQEVVIATCGVGKVYAAICTQTMILIYQPTLIINTGVGGTLTEKLGIGDVAVATALVQHDMDTSAIGDPVGLVSGINRIYFEADPKTVDKLAYCVTACSMHAERGVIASGDQFVASRERKEFITTTFGAIACEMEGAAVAHVATVNGLPFAAVRAISDEADGHATVDFPTFAAHAAENSVAVLRRFLATLG